MAAHHHSSATMGSLGLLFVIMQFASRCEAKCECEAQRLAVSMTLAPSASLPTLPPNGVGVRHDPDPNDASEAYKGCGAILVTGRASSPACGMRWGFGVYMRLPQCGQSVPFPCGDWCGHPVYKHSWKENYLWGDYGQTWFLGPGVGDYNAIYGYAEHQTTITRAEQISNLSWAAWSVDHWSNSSVRLKCVDPDAKTTVTAPTAAPAILVDAKQEANAASRCEQLFLSGWASAYSTGLHYAFGGYHRIGQFAGRPTFQHNTKPVFLFSDPVAGRWILADRVGSPVASAFVESNSTSPLLIASDPNLVKRRWMGVVLGLGTWSPAQVDVQCVNTTFIAKAPTDSFTKEVVTASNTEVSKAATKVNDETNSTMLLKTASKADYDMDSTISASTKTTTELSDIFPGIPTPKPDANELARIQLVGLLLDKLAERHATTGSSDSAAVNTQHWLTKKAEATMMSVSAPEPPACEVADVNVDVISFRVEVLFRSCRMELAAILAEELGTQSSELGFQVEVSHVLQRPSGNTSMTFFDLDGIQHAPVEPPASFPRLGELLTGDDLSAALHAQGGELSPCAPDIRELCSDTDTDAAAECLQARSTELSLPCQRFIKELEHVLAQRDAAVDTSSNSVTSPTTVAPMAGDNDVGAAVPLAPAFSAYIAAACAILVWSS